MAITEQDLTEIERIKQLKAHYFQYLDGKQWDQLEQVFCDDVIVDCSEDGSPILNGRRAFREFLEPLIRDVITAHQGHDPRITITGPDSATGIWSMEDRLWWPAAEGGRHLWGLGSYHEKYRREPDGEWRIQELVLKRIRVEVNGEQVIPPPTGK